VSRLQTPAPAPPEHRAAELVQLVSAASVFDALVDVLADRILAKLEGRSTVARYADVEASPYRTGRAFLDAARREEFPTFLRSRRVTALWGDCEQAIERRKRARPPTTQDELERAELEKMGVKLRLVNDTAPAARKARR
jgi:hypothetical protein